MRGRGCKLTRGSQKHSHFQLPWVCACLLLESPRSVQRILALGSAPWKKLSGALSRTQPAFSNCLGQLQTISKDTKPGGHWSRLSTQNSTDFPPPLFCPRFKNRTSRCPRSREREHSWSHCKSTLFIYQNTVLLNSL